MRLPQLDPALQGAAEVLRNDPQGRALDLSSMHPLLHAGIYSINKHFLGASPAGPQAGSEKETPWGAQTQAAHTHAWLQEAWLKRQLKMKLPSLLSSSRDVKVFGSRDRMLM